MRHVLLIDLGVEGLAGGASEHLDLPVVALGVVVVGDERVPELVHVLAYVPAVLAAAHARERQAEAALRHDEQLGGVDAEVGARRHGVEARAGERLGGGDEPDLLPAVRLLAV